ncbi:serine threonine kinase protein [Rutstroemia sp. NJR-2017a BVV2]|nr:serine threonine kinase protein [Rutstroemia sp. NJR-2017a BVV2]
MTTMSNPQLQELAIRLIGAMVDNFKQSKFLVYSSLSRIIDETDFDSCLREAGLRHRTVREEVREAILNGGRKLFAVLAIMRDHPIHLLVKFLGVDHMAAGNFDSQLPFRSLDHLKRILGNEMLAAEFFQYQWSVTSPLFREDRSHREFDQETVLPFVKREKIGSGANGAVYKIIFHEDHHEFGFATRKEPVELACKEMGIDTSEEAFRAEE